MNSECLPREKISIKKTDKTIIELLMQELSVSLTMATILAARGLDSFDVCKDFFRPEISHFHDPFCLSGMQNAVDRILKAIENDEKIIIHGDYDVDGVTSTVLLVRYLRRIGCKNCSYYLPNRLTEGYGISKKGIDKMHAQGVTLIITVDCGITANKEVAYAKELGIDCIITDHHEPHDILPDAIAVIDPKKKNDTYPDKNLAGVGVALKLCQALNKAKEFDDKLWVDLLDIVSLGTAADIVPLVGENRIIVKIGFELLSKTVNIGLRSLIKLQSIDKQPISTSEVVFLLAPCINAAGRLGDSSRGVKMLLTEDESEADLFAKELVALNLERRALDKHVQDSAVSWVNDNVDFSDEFSLVAGHTDWHVGVIGIAASKLVEKYYRPTFLFSIGKDGLAKGSGRSIRGLHLLDALKDCEHLLVSYGGHKAAAGATVKAENLPALREAFNTAVQARLTKDNLVPLIIADAEVDIAGLTPKFFRIVKQMEPFGPGNMRPVLLCHGLTNKYKPRVVGKNHLKMTVKKHGQVMDAIAFNFGERINEIQNSDTFSLAFSLDENTWNGKTSLQMKVKGVSV